MSKARSIDDHIKDTEYILAKYKAVKAKFPTARVNAYMEFSDKAVNKAYTELEFVTRHGGLFALPFCVVEFEHDGKAEKIKVYSSPRANRLVYTRYHYRDNKKVMKFSRLSINLKNNQFKNDMLNTCRAEIMKFIASHPGFELDEKHLEPRLKKLMIFT